MLPLFIAYYNFVRKHRALKMADGSYLTPAEMAGVDKDFGNDKWLGLIRKASRTACLQKALRDTDDSWG